MSRRRNRSNRQYSEKENPNVAVVVQNQGVGTPAMMPRNMRAYIQEGYRGSITVFTVVGEIAPAGAGIKWKHHAAKKKKRGITSPNQYTTALSDLPPPQNKIHTS